MKIYVNTEVRGWKKYKIDFARIARAALRAANANAAARVSITLTDDAHIRELNREYRNMDKPTNVLSFELGDATLLGDIFISLDTVKREAAEQHISVADHVAHLVVHGVLHLMGYDHIRDVDAARMEKKEIQILAKMGIKNPYEDIVSGATACDINGCPGAWINKLKIPVGGWVEIALYALCGGIAAFGFAPFHLWWTTLLAIGVAYWMTVRDTRRMSVWRVWRRVFAFGAMYAISLFWWTLNSIYVVPELAHQFAIWTVPALMGFGIAGGLVFSLPFVAVRMFGGVSPSGRVFVFSGTWTLVLWLREWAFTGFPWNPIANIFIDLPPIANSMSVWGALGLTFITVGLVASVTEMVRFRARRGVAVTIVFTAMMIAGAVLGMNNISRAAVGSGDANIIIRVVQPAQSQSDKMNYTSRADALRGAANKIIALTNLALSVGDSRIDLVVFPETTYPFVVSDEEMYMGQLVGTNVVIGATGYADGRTYNSLVVGDTSGVATNIYHKSHLVPFGEYRPLGILPAPVNLSRGDGAELISLNLNGTDFVFAPAICYEIIFSDSLVPRTDMMPNAIINITNDTWFGNTPGVYQHLDMVRRYAVESGLPIIRANYSGISAFIDSAGAVTAALPVGEMGVLDGTVWGAHDTIYRTLGRDIWMILILLAASVGAIIARIFDGEK